MAARSGATPRELLATCRDLHRSGALQAIRVRWGAAMRQQHWRLAFEPGTTATSLCASLARLPGCSRIEQAEGGAALSTVWAEIDALDEAALQRQLDRLPQRPSARLRLPALPDEDTRHCEDPALAASIERGLNLCSKPYADCARRLGCSEHRVLAHLQAWRRSGQLEYLMLTPPPTRVPQSGLIALWRQLQPSPELLSRLEAHGNVDRVVGGHGRPEWPWRLSLVLRAAPRLAHEQLRELQADVGLTDPPASCAALLIHQPRDQALLFDTEG